MHHASVAAASLMAALLLGCGPSAGDLYEHLPSGERVRVGCVGEAQQCLGLYSRLREVSASDSSLLGHHEALRTVGRPVLVGPDSTVDVVTVTHQVHGIPMHFVTPRRRFEREYRAVR